jgi:hypothetical protein
VVSGAQPTLLQVDLLFGKFEEGMAAAGGGGGAGGDRLLIGVLRRTVDSDKQVTPRRCKLSFCVRGFTAVGLRFTARVCCMSSRFCVSSLKCIPGVRRKGTAAIKWPPLKHNDGHTGSLHWLAVGLWWVCSPSTRLSGNGQLLSLCKSEAARVCPTGPPDGPCAAAAVAARTGGAPANVDRRPQQGLYRRAVPL